MELLIKLNKDLSQSHGDHIILISYLHNESITYVAIYQNNIKQLDNPDII